MTHRVLTTHEELELAEQHVRELRNRLVELDNELSLYDANGPWRYFQARLEAAEHEAQEALLTGPLEDVPGNRGKLRLVRNLLSLPGNLGDLRARLVAELEEAASG